MNDIGDANSDFEDAKTSEEHLDDFINLADWDTDVKKNVKEMIVAIREKINL